MVVLRRSSGGYSGSRWICEWRVSAIGIRDSGFFRVVRFAVFGGSSMTRRSSQKRRCSRVDGGGAREKTRGGLTIHGGFWLIRGGRQG